MNHTTTNALEFTLAARVVKAKTLGAGMRLEAHDVVELLAQFPQLEKRGALNLRDAASARVSASKTRRAKSAVIEPEPKAPMPLPATTVEEEQKLGRQLAEEHQQAAGGAP